MEQSSDHTFTGPAKIPSMKIPQKVGRAAWGIQPGSNDASLFSSSLPVLSHENLNSTKSEHGVQSIGAVSSDSQFHQDQDNKESFEDMELHTIGNRLPDDEEELLAGIMDDFDLSGLPSQVEDLEDYDVFGSGGMELDFDSQEALTIGLANASILDSYAGNGSGQFGLPNGMGAVAGEHPYGEHPSRTLFVRNINSNVEDMELRTLFEILN